MALPTAKELKKLAAACRAAGINSFKCGELEFTLGDKPTKPSKNGNTKVHKGGDVMSVIDEAFEEDGLTQDALLMWSALPADGTGEEQPQ
jgi:hypothetical protein